ncbi:MAG TPA: hypothetical protein VIE47_03275 [Methylocystis sp.]
MSRSATVLGCALALTAGIQMAEASSCIDHQLVDKLGQVVRDANGHPVPCGLDPSAGDRGWTASAGDPGSFAGDQGAYLGAGTLLVGGGIAAVLATSNNGGGSSQQNQLLSQLLLNNNGNSGGGRGVGNPASP